MTLERRRARRAGWSILLFAPMLIGAAAPGGDFEARVLAAHNQERAALGVPALRWSPTLAAAARSYAEHLAGAGRFEHAPPELEAPQGENLWVGEKGTFSPEAMVSAWIREKRFFKAGAFPDNSTTGRIDDVRHYTQLVWRATGEVGCATVSDGDEDFLVCRYVAAGNATGQRPL